VLTDSPTRAPLSSVGLQPTENLLFIVRICCPRFCFWTDILRPLVSFSSPLRTARRRRRSFQSCVRAEHFAKKLLRALCDVTLDSSCADSRDETYGTGALQMQRGRAGVRRQMKVGKCMRGNTLRLHQTGITPHRTIKHPRNESKLPRLYFKLRAQLRAPKQQRCKP